MPAAPALTEIRDAPAWYGKLSSIGDFAQRRFPSELLGRCDEWLSEGMRSGPQRLGERWLSVYLQAPLLRFAWAPGVLDTRWWFGVWMPSCDDVGRYFPLLIVHPRQRPPADRVGFDHLELWYEHLGQAALRTLAPNAHAVDALEAALHDAPPWPAPAIRGAWTDGLHAGIGFLRLRPGAHLAQWLHALALQNACEALAGCSVWWPVAPDAGQPRVDVVRGLPRDAAFLDLLESRDAHA